MSEKFAFIDAQKAVRNPDGRPRYQVRLMCAWLSVSTSGFYEWAARGRSATAAWRAELGEVIAVIFAESEGTYGYRRVHAELARRGRPCHRETVRSIMGELGLVACQPRARRRCLTKAGEQVGHIPDLVGRDFTSDTPGAKLVMDITYVRTWQGWLYVALVIDCCSRGIVGYAMADHYRTPLITEAIEMAARNIDIPDGAVAHSDRGSNYTSDEFAAVLSRLGLSRSVGRTGNCFDNALAESTNGFLKVELVNRKQYPTREMAKKDITRWIELFYNRRRLHSGIGYKTPNEILASHRETRKTA
ncbi:MAG: IS3 family transposase [Actinomycetia bacterium]|nr:IS3 family transposase [Actinomycetes bacterium]